MAFHLTAPTLAPFGSTKKLDVFQRIKYPSQNEEEIKPKTLKPRTVKDDTLENPHFSEIFLFIVRHWFLANSIQGKIDDLTLGFDA